MAAASAGVAALILRRCGPITRMRPTRLEPEADPGPDRARGRRRDRVLVGPGARIGTERAVGIEGIAGQEARGRVLLVEGVDEPSEQIDVLAHVVGALQIHHGVAWNPARAGR